MLCGRASAPYEGEDLVAGGRQRMAEGNRKGSAVYPVFLSVQNPLDLGDASPQDNSPYSYILRAAGLPANGQRLGAQRCHHPRRADVPRIGDDETAGLVKVIKCLVAI